MRKDGLVFMIVLIHKWFALEDVAGKGYQEYGEQYNYKL